MESTFLWMGDAFRRASDSYCLFPSFLFLKYTEAIFKSIMAFIFEPSETLGLSTWKNQAEHLGVGLLTGSPGVTHTMSLGSCPQQDGTRVAGGAGQLGE